MEGLREFNTKNKNITTYQCPLSSSHFPPLTQACETSKNPPMAPPTSANGILPAPAILQKQNPAPTHAPRGPASRKPAVGPRTKVIVRRLPPGLTQQEFEAALGEEWRVGAGKVNWFDYRAGKITKEYVAHLTTFALCSSLEVIQSSCANPKQFLQTVQTCASIPQPYRQCT